MGDGPPSSPALQQLCDRPAQLRHGPSQAAVSPVLRRRSRRTVAAMRRLILASATTALAFLLLVPPAWAEWVWPVRGEVITPYRNGTDPYASGQHRGIDIAAATGATVVAATSGEVRFAGTAGSSGLTVSVRTADGRYDTSYLHLSSTSVGEGDRVAAGQPLGAVGTSGTRSATEPHLHFGVRDAGSRHAYHDPLRFLPPPTATQPPRGAPAPEPAPVPISPGPAPAPVNAPATPRGGGARRPPGSRAACPWERRAPGQGERPAACPQPSRTVSQQAMQAARRTVRRASQPQGRRITSPSIRVVVPFVRQLRTAPRRHTPPARTSVYSPLASAYSPPRPFSASRATAGRPPARPATASRAYCDR